MRLALLGALVVCGCDVPGGSLDMTDAGATDAFSDALRIDAGGRDASLDVLALDADDLDAGIDAFDASIDDGGTQDAFDAALDVGIDAPMDACEPDDACNGLDDDCDGFIDEDGCEGCTRVEAAGVPSHVYLFCDDAKIDWDEGFDRCEGIGYRLADVQTEIEHSFVWMRAQSVRDDHWWIGLREIGGDWQWTRAEIAHPSDDEAYDGWMSGNPSDGEECGRMKKDADGVEATFSDGGWETKSCADNNFVVCEVGG